MTRLIAMVFGVALLLAGQATQAKGDKPPFIWEKIATVDLTKKEIVI